MAVMPRGTRVTTVCRVLLSALTLVRNLQRPYFVSCKKLSNVGRLPIAFRRY